MAAGASGALPPGFPEVVMRAFGGAMYLAGALIMVFNIWMTIAGHLRDEAPLHSNSLDEAADRPLPPQAQPAE